MARDFFIYGETMVYVKGGAHLSLIDGSPMTVRTELGLASDQIRISPVYRKKDIIIDNFGRNVPVDVMSMMSECTIEMNLIHFDSLILNICIAESNGGVDIEKNPVFDRVDFTIAGTAGKAGALMGKGLDYFASGNNFISLSLYGTGSVHNGNITKMRFPTSYIADRIDYPIGTKNSAVKVTWRAIPYIPRVSGVDYLSISGTIFDSETDLDY